METTKPVLSSSRSASASSDRHGGKLSDDVSVRPPHLEGKGLWMRRLMKPLETGEGPERRQSVVSSRDGETQPRQSITAVLASLNRINVLREKTKALRGNVTKDTPLRKFEPATVAEEMQRILDTALKGVVYEPKRASVLAKSLSDSIKVKVKTMKFPRYRFVATVTISSKSDQSMMVASRCLWNYGSDTYATVYFTNDSIAAVATIFAILKE